MIAAYRPRRGPEAAGVFARHTVARVEPPSAERAKALLWSCARLGSFGISVGLEPTPAVLLHPSVIERFVVCTPGLSGPARRSLRTNLRWVAARLSGGPTPRSLSRERAKAPYTDAEIAAYLGLADAQPTLARRMRAQGLICLGAGAGLTGGDLRQLRGTDVVCRSGGVVAVVGGRRARVVPVLARYQPRLVASAAFAGSGWVIGGVDPERHNVTTPLISALAGGVDMARLQTPRLRSTWLAAVAEGLGLATFLAAAGISCSQRLGDIAATLAPAAEAEAVTLLSGG
ncbi:MAG: hypothetical protein ACRDY5_03475 [Acidimicrobiales bacterium]